MTHVKYLSHNDRFSLNAAAILVFVAVIIIIIILTTTLSGRIKDIIFSIIPGESVTRPHWMLEIADSTESFLYYFFYI
jgi:hypothetical protein